MVYRVLLIHTSMDSNYDFFVSWCGRIVQRFDECLITERNVAHQNNQIVIKIIAEQE